ncbi:MAG: DUF2203 domain-containing protein [Verrucomicrobiota bacterium]
MAWRYSKHYTRDEARALLPQIREWLEQLAQGRQQLSQAEQHMLQPLSDGYDLGGTVVNQWASTLADIKDILNEFQQRQIEIKDLDRGLIDFPAFVGGKEVFLCWEKDEEDIEYWHDLTSGYAGRERID